MNATWLDAGVRQIARASITGYQKYISPHKGFACAHRMLYEGESCSQYVKRMVAEKDLLAAIKASKQRFQACKEANRIFRASREQTEPEKSRKPKKNGISCLEDPSICFSGWDCSGCQLGAEEINCFNCSVFECCSCDILNCGN